MSRDLPEWWGWEAEFSPHLLRRMLDRGFTEIELRALLEDAIGLHPDPGPGRWRVETTHRGRPWRVIVEPDFLLQVLVVVTAFPTGRSN